MPERSHQPIPPSSVPEQTIDAQALKHKAVGGAVSYFLRTLALFGVSLFAQVLLTDKLQPEDFGIYGFVIQMIGLLTFFSDVGLAAKLVQQSDEPSEAEYATAFTIQHLLGWFIVCCVGAVVVSGWFAPQLGSVGGWIALSLAFSFPLASLKTVPALKLERRLQFQTLIIPQIVEHMVFNIVLIAGVWTHYGLWAYVGAIVLRSIAGVLAMASIEWWVPRFLIAPHIVRPLLKRGLQFQANDLLARVKDQFYFLMLGVVLPLREFGYLNWAKNWSMYPYNLTVQNVMAITFPTFARLQHHPELLRKAIEKTLYWIALSVTPMIVAMCVFVPPLATLIPRYQKWQPALTSLVWFSMSIVWGALSTPLTNTLNAVGHIKKTLGLMIMWTILTWAATPLMMRWFGFEGVAIAAFLVGCSSVMTFVLVKQHVQIALISTLWVQLVAGAFMALMGWQLQSYMSGSWQGYGFGVVITTLCYLVGVLALGGRKFFLELSSLVKKH